MIIFTRTAPQETLIQRLKRLDWEKSMRNISEGEIVSMNTDPLGTQSVKLPEVKDDNNGTK